MTVKELKDRLSEFDDNENVYILAGNYPSEHYKTRDIEVSKYIYGSVSDENGKTIDNPLIII